MADWIDTFSSRSARMRRADVKVPAQLSIDLQAHREILIRWARAERREAARTTLLREVREAGIERAESACDLLLRDGWIERRERLEGGTWHWHTIAWRDLGGLQRLLGVVGRQQREDERRHALIEAQAWLAVRAQSGLDAEVDPDLLDELTRALEQLETERTLPVDVLRTRLRLLRAVADWHDSGGQGPRRVFALRVGGDTKAIGQADWRWLEASFDLERLRIEAFVPQIWMAGDASLRWSEGQLDLRVVRYVGLPLQDVTRLQGLHGVERYWLIENRASFERQARGLPPGVLLLWMPGRPSSVWMQAVSHLIATCPAPSWISADADPSGVDIACTAMGLWAARGLLAEPHQMGAAQLASTSQNWPLNQHDERLLDRLLNRVDLTVELQLLCEAMRKGGRKAEQEAWL